MAGFAGLRVLSLESRRGREIAQLITSQGGEPVVAASVSEVPAPPNDHVRRFMAALSAGEVDLVIFTTGVGTRALAQSPDCDRERLISALQRIPAIARSSKPGSVLRELGIPIAAMAPEPNTYREVLQVLDHDRERFPLRGWTVAVQEYGAISNDLHAGLTERGAKVMPVVVYEWSLPADLEPLRDAIRGIIAGEIDVTLFTATVQVQHLLHVAGETKQRDALLDALRRTVVCSIGPVTSTELRAHGIEPDLEPEHPKMGFLVAKAAKETAAIRERKRG